MKIILAIFLIISSYNVLCQKLPIPTYKKLVFGKDSIECRRTTDKEIKKFLMFDGSPFDDAIISIIQAEKILTSNEEIARKGQVYFSSDSYYMIRKHIQNIAQNCPECDTSDYENELRFYMKIQNKVADSLNVVTEKTKIKNQSNPINQIVDTSRNLKSNDANALNVQRNDPILSANMAALAWHGKLTQFTNMDLNFVTERVDDYMNSALMGFSTLGPPKFEIKNNQGIRTDKYLPAVMGAVTTSFIQFKYFTTISGKDFIIDSCVISGKLQFLINFYVSYWTTKINFEGRKDGEIVHNHLLNDDISFQFFPSNEVGKIIIKQTTEINK